MNEDDPGQQSKEAGRDSGFVSSFFDDVFSQVIWDGLSYVVVGVLRGVGTVLGWMLELLP